MLYYTKENETFENITCLKPTICKSCRADGDSMIGHCEECLKNQAWNKEYVETHLFECDPYFRPYHSGGKHSNFKCTPYRMPGEKPYLYYGIEIEIEFDRDYLKVFYEDEDGYEDEDEPSNDTETMLSKFTEITGGMFVYEKDGSLENGIEFISRPMSYAKWVDKDTVEKLKAGLEYLKKEWGAFENQPNSNGMHIHISKKFFDYGDLKRTDRNDAYRDMDWLFQYFQEELEKIGGRKYTGFCDSKVNKIKREYGIGTQCNRDSRWNVELEIKGKMKKGGRMAEEDHYSAVTLSGKTIEGRIFNSTTDYKHVLANIELMRNFAHAVRDAEITGKTLNDILHTKDNQYLDGVLDEVKKNLYKNSKEKFSLERVAEDEMEIK